MPPPHLLRALELARRSEQVMQEGRFAIADPTTPVERFEPDPGVLPQRWRLLGKVVEAVERGRICSQVGGSGIGRRQHASLVDCRSGISPYVVSSVVAAAASWTPLSSGTTRRA